jgi:hypothetical protein
MAMSDSLLNKGAVVLNAIAITTALAIISGQIPLGSLAKLQSALNFNSHRSQLMPRP